MAITTALSPLSTILIIMIFKINSALSIRFSSFAGDL
jgi:hypothetical protein